MKLARVHRNPPLNRGVSSAHGVFLIYPDWRFPWIYSVVRQISGYKMQSQGTARTPIPQARRLHLSAWKKVAYPQFATEPVWAQNTDS